MTNQPIPIQYNDETYIVHILNVSDEGEMEFDYETPDGNALSPEHEQGLANQIVVQIAEAIQRAGGEVEWVDESDLTEEE